MFISKVARSLSLIVVTVDISGLGAWVSGARPTALVLDDTGWRHGVAIGLTPAGTRAVLDLETGFGWEIGQSPKTVARVARFQDEAAADALVREAGDAIAVRADQSNPANLEVLFEAVTDGLDILVNNAAINPHALIRDITPELFEPADVADVVAFLAGPDARWITGQNIQATGGLLL